VFDTVERLNWKVDVRKHIIKTIVRDVLEGGVWWGDDDEEEGRDDTLLDGWHWNRRKEKWVVPKPIIESECVDCYKWEFGDFGNDRYN
jgi:lipase ATG15